MITPFIGRRDEGREEEEDREEIGGGSGGVGGGAQSSLLSESRAVLILFVWPHTFPAFLSLFTAAVALMILALASSFTPPASLLFFMGLLPVVFSSSSW